MKIVTTDIALKELDSIKKQKSLNSMDVRIYIQGHGWGGPSFGIALDEQTEDDYSIEVSSGKIVVENILLDRYQGFEIDYANSWLTKGFVVRPYTGGSTC